MRFPLVIASGDPVLFALLAGMLVLVGGTLALGITGGVLLLGKDTAKKHLGKRLVAAAALLVVAGAAIWVSVVGWD
ncbi:MAG TPA: hypothetical protein VMM36_19485 [Opitutaceae bacterium]|nr:hypothetical protein [Opitutaceae bacterium]